MSTRQSELGRHLVARRAQLGLTQDVAAKRSGISLRTWQNLENGVVSQPRAETLFRISRVIEAEYEALADLVTKVPTEAERPPIVATEDDEASPPCRNCGAPRGRYGMDVVTPGNQHHVQLRTAHPEPRWPLVGPAHVVVCSVECLAAWASNAHRRMGRLLDEENGDAPGTRDARTSS